MSTNKTITTSPASLSDDALRDTLAELQSAVVDQCLNSAGLVIGTTDAAEVKLTNATYTFADGIISITAAAVEVALSGTVANAAFNVFVLYVTSAGAIASAMGTAGATIGAVVFPAIPVDSAVIGFVIINPTGTGDFVGATTDLDDATVVPTAVYINTVGTFNPNVLAL